MTQNVLVVAIFVGAIAFTGYNILVNRFKASQPSEELQPTFNNIHDKYAREPSEKMAKVKIIHRDFMQEIERTFRRNGICHHLEQTSNSHEAVLVKRSSADDDITFEAMLVIDEYEYDLQVLHDNSRPGYAWLNKNRRENPSPELEKVLKYWNFFGYIFAGDLYVDPDMTIDVFFTELNNLIKKSVLMKGKVKLSRHGLAIRMDVHPNSGVLFWGPRLYSVELVPAYQVGGALYISKPLKREVSNRMTWRRSFSVQEKLKLSEGTKCVLRALEAVRNRQPGLASLTSHHIKLALLYEMDEECDWS